MRPLEAEGMLRGRNQLTLPKEIADATGLREGQRLIFAVDSERPGEIVLRPLRDSYAGLLTGVYGATAEEREAYLRGERDSWT
jgi:bifunctional DNA-binding transcriptional regulator/antitoxin component of YhaV-PrlF toxin-antitoxin module